VAVVSFHLLAINTIPQIKNTNSTTDDIKVTLSILPVTKKGILLRISNPKTTRTALI
jgi:hypothetical protein